MAGFLFGLIMGLIALGCLGRFTAAITAGQPQRALLPLLGNILAIGAGLFVPAFVLRQDLAWAGVGLAGALVGGAFALFILRTCRRH